ncbi:MAG: flavoprotein, partial [Nitrospira sp.]
MTSKLGKNILLGVSGSIAAYKACDLITSLRELGHTVTVVMTKDAHHFITALSLQSFAGTEVIQDFFSTEGRLKPIHIELAKKADVILIAPASADIIARLAHGLADDLLSTLCLARNCPLIIAPAMNREMWLNAATQRNITQLINDGVQVLGPDSGVQACGETGVGRMLEADVLAEEVLAFLRGNNHAAAPEKILLGKTILI